MANTLTTQSGPIMERFGRIMVNILEALNDVTKYDENGVMSDLLIYIEGQSLSCYGEEDSYYETEHDQRKKQLILSDPVHNIVLRDYLQSQVNG